MKIGIYCTTHKSIPPEGHGGVQLINWISADGLVDLGHEVLLFANGKSKTKAELIKMPVGSGPQHEEGLAILFEKNIKSCDVLIDTSTYSYPGRLYADIPYLVRTGGDCNKRYCQFWTRNIIFPSIDHAKHHNQKNGCACSKQRKNQNIPKILRKPVGYWTFSKDVKDFDQFCYKDMGNEYYLYFGIIEPIKGTHLAVEFAKKAQIPLMIIGPIKDKNYFDTKIKPFLNNHIAYSGELPSSGPEKWNILGGAKALVFPTDCHDADPNVPKESLMVKTPVIGLANGAVPEIVTDRVTGVLCNSVDEMVNRISELDMINPEDCQKSVLEKFSVDNFIHELSYLCEFATDGQRWY